MIVRGEVSDEWLAIELQQKLAIGDWALFDSEIAPLDQVPSRLSEALSSPAIFAVGSDLERLALLVAGLRHLTHHPIIAAAHGGTISRIVQLVRVGASDVLDLGASIDAQMISIVENIQSLSSMKLNDNRLLSGLTSSQQRVAPLLLTDLTENEIARKLDLSYFTVHNHVKEIYRRCGVHSRLQFITASRKSIDLAATPLYQS